MARRTYYDGFNRRLWRLANYMGRYDQRMAKKTAMDSAALTALHALETAIAAAQLAFPDNSELP